VAWRDTGEVLVEIRHGVVQAIERVAGWGTQLFDNSACVANAEQALQAEHDPELAAWLVQKYEERTNRVVASARLQLDDNRDFLGSLGHSRARLQSKLPDRLSLLT
jgi:hypothetical protein